MSAPSPIGRTLLSSREVPVFFTASLLRAGRDLPRRPLADLAAQAVEVTATLVSKRGLSALAVYTYCDHLDRIDITARQEPTGPFTPVAVAKRALLAATGISYRPKALRPYVRVDAIEPEGERATLVLPHVYVVSQCQSANFPIRLRPYGYEDLLSDHEQSRFDPDPAKTFYPTVAYDATLAVETLK